MSISISLAPRFNSECSTRPWTCPRVTSRSGTPIFVRDIATTESGAMPREGAVTRDAKGEALSATVVILKGANSHAVIERVTKRLDEIRKLLPAGVTIRTFYNQGEVV